MPLTKHANNFLDEVRQYHLAIKRNSNISISLLQKSIEKLIIYDLEVNRDNASLLFDYVQWYVAQWGASGNQFHGKLFSHVIGGLIAHINSLFLDIEKKNMLLRKMFLTTWEIPSVLDTKDYPSIRSSNHIFFHILSILPFSGNLPSMLHLELLNIWCAMGLQYDSHNSICYFNSLRITYEAFHEIFIPDSAFFRNLYLYHIHNAIMENLRHGRVAFLERYTCLFLDRAPYGGDFRFFDQVIINASRTGFRDFLMLLGCYRNQQRWINQAQYDEIMLTHLKPNFSPLHEVLGTHDPEKIIVCCSEMQRYCDKNKFKAALQYPNQWGYSVLQQAINNGPFSGVASIRVATHFLNLLDEPLFSNAEIRDILLVLRCHNRKTNAAVINNLIAQRQSRIAILLGSSTTQPLRHFGMNRSAPLFIAAPAVLSSQEAILCSRYASTSTATQGQQVTELPGYRLSCPLVSGEKPNIVMSSSGDDDVKRDQELSVVAEMFLK